MNDEINKLFRWYEENIFENNNQYLSRNTNLIVGFADYIDSLSDHELDGLMNVDNIKEARYQIEKGCEKYLLNNHKTLGVM